MGLATGRAPLQAVVTLVTLGILCVSLASKAQQPTKVYRIGRLSPGHSPSGPSPSMEAFRQELRDLGYVEGQNLIIEWRWAEGREERLPDWRPS